MKAGYWANRGPKSKDLPSDLTDLSDPLINHTREGEAQLLDVMDHLWAEE